MKSKNKNSWITKGICYVGILLFLGSALFILSGCANLKYDTDRDEVIQSPDESYSLTIRYDYVSRPDIYKDGKRIFEYSGSGFMENVYWDIEWVSDNEIMLYIKSPQRKKYNNEKYYITFD